MCECGVGVSTLTLTIDHQKMAAMVSGDKLTNTMTCVFCVSGVEDDKVRGRQCILQFDYVRGSVGKNTARLGLSYRHTVKEAGFMDLTPLLSSRMKTALNQMNEETFTRTMKYAACVSGEDTTRTVAEGHSACSYATRRPILRFVFDFKYILEAAKYGMDYIRQVDRLIKKNQKYSNKAELTVTLKKWGEFDGISPEALKSLCSITKKLPQGAICDPRAVHTRDYIEFEMTMTAEPAIRLPTSFEDPLISFFDTLKAGGTFGVVHYEMTQDPDTLNVEFNACNTKETELEKQRKVWKP